METLQSVCSKDRLSQLEVLRNKLANAIDGCTSMRDLASLSKQYRETLYEIENIRGTNDETDEISEILSSRVADGKSGAVRKGSTKL